jgi:glycosyltransferase involved in cell wall biosynthesis
MKILQICSAKTIGGGERHVSDLTESLAARGHQIFAALAPNSPLANELQLPPENLLFSRMRNALDFFSAFELARFIRQNDIEIIHAHLARDYPLAATAARLTNASLVLTRHVLFPLNPLHKFALRGVSGVIAVSNAVSDSLKSAFPPEKIETVHNGINTKRFSPSAKKQNRMFTIGTIGHLAPIKGQIDFIRAAAIVLEKRQNVEFVIVGEDKSPGGRNLVEIERLIAELNLQTKVRLVGWIDDVREQLASLDLFVSAARTEPFGLVIAESMACQIPVVATRTDGALEIIEDNVNGKLVPIGEPESLARTILNLLDDEKGREQLAAKGRQRVCEEFSLEKMVLKTEDFYHRILAKSAS